MLARANRLITPDDYRSTLRKGRRIRTATVIVCLNETDRSGPPRFGFVVTRKVGNAVKRNLVRRRLKAISRECIDSLANGTDVVMRALPGSAQESWANLQDEVSAALNRGGGK